MRDVRTADLSEARLAAERVKEEAERFLVEIEKPRSCLADHVEERAAKHEEDLVLIRAEEKEWQNVLALAGDAGDSGMISRAALMLKALGLEGERIERFVSRDKKTAQKMRGRRTQEPPGLQLKAITLARKRLAQAERILGSDADGGSASASQPP